MLARLKSIFNSRKMMVGAAGVVVWLARQLGADISLPDAILILTLFGVLIGATALEDFGTKRAGGAPVQPGISGVGAKQFPGVVAVVPKDPPAVTAIGTVNEAPPPGHPPDPVDLPIPGPGITLGGKGGAP